MTGWQRFFLLILCYFIMLVFFPYYDGKGLSFIFLTFAMWTGVIILLSIIVNLFALYKLPPLNALFTLIFVLVVMGSLLIYFPQEGRLSPINQLKTGQLPTTADIEMGIKRLTFNFDFVRRNVERDENYINQMTPEQRKKKAEEEAAEVAAAAAKEAAATQAEIKKVMRKKKAEPKPEMEIIVE